MPDVINQATAGMQNFNSVLEQGVNHSRQQEQIWSGMGKMWLLLEAGVLGTVLKTTQLGHRIHDAFSEVRASSARVQAELADSVNTQREAVRAQEDQLAVLAASANLSRESERQDLVKNSKMLAQERKKQVLLESQLNLKQQILRVNSQNAMAVSLVLTATFNTFREVQAMNRALVNGNSALEKRLDLSNQIFGIQAMTGASAQESAQIAAALTEYGLDMAGNFKDNGILVSQMMTGLNMSADSAARIVLFSQIHKTNAREIADAMVRVVESTALTANETERIVEAVQGAMVVLRAGITREDAAVSEYLARLEGRLKEVGGVQGEITRFYERVMTTTDGAGLGAMVGIMDPEKLAGAKGTKLLSEGIQRMVENSTRGLTGTARIAQLEALAQITGLSVRTLSQFSEAMSKTTTSLDTATTIEERWNRTVEQTGQIVSVAVGRMYAILQRSLLPTLTLVFRGIGWVNDRLGELLGWMEKYEVEAKALGSVVMAGATVALGVLVVQLKRVAVSAYQTAAALQAQIAGNVGVAATGGMGLRSRASALASTITARGTTRMLPFAETLRFIGTASFLTAATAVVSSLLVGAGIGTWIYKRFVEKPLSEADAKIAHVEATAQQNLLDSTMKKARAAAASSDFETIDFLLKKVREDGFRNTAKLGVHDAATLEKQIIAEVANAANFKFADAFRETGGGMVNATAEQTRILQELLNYQKRATEGSEQYWDKQSEEAKKAREEMHKKAAEEAEAKRRQELKLEKPRKNVSYGAWGGQGWNAANW